LKEETYNSNCDGMTIWSHHLVGLVDHPKFFL